MNYLLGVVKLRNVEGVTNAILKWPESVGKVQRSQAQPLADLALVDTICSWFKEILEVRVLKCHIGKQIDLLLELISVDVIEIG
jgi:hypothetical protein